MTDKIIILDLKGKGSDQPQVSSVPKAPGKFPFDNILKSDPPEAVTKKLAPEEAQILKIKQEKDQRKKDGIPLKAKEILVTKSRTNADEMREELTARTEKALAGKKEQTSQKNKNDAVMDTDARDAEKHPELSLSEDETRPGDEIQVSPGEHEDRTSPIPVDLDAQAEPAAPSFVAAMNNLIHQDQSEQKLQSAKLNDKHSRSAAIINPLTSAKSQQRVLTAKPLKENIESEAGKEQNMTDSKGTIQTPVRKAQNLPTQLKNTTAKPGDRPHSGPKRTMHDLTRGAHLRKPGPRPKVAEQSIADQKVAQKSSSFAASTKRHVSEAGSESAIKLKGTPVDRLTEMERAGKQPAASPQKDRLPLMRSAEMDWSRRSTHIPPKVVPAQPGKVPRAKSYQQPVKPQVERPLNARIGHTFVVEKDKMASPVDPAVSNQNLKPAPSGERENPVSTHSKAKTVSPPDSVKPTRSSKQAAGIHQKPIPSAKPAQRQSANRRVELEQPNREVVVNRQPSESVEKQSAESVEAPATSKSTVAAVVQTQTQLPKVKSSQKRRLKFEIPITRKYSSLTRSSLDKASLLSRRSRLMGAADLSQQPEQKDTEFLNEADSLKQDLRDRIEVLKKAQENYSIGQMPPQSSSMHQGLSAKIPGSQMVAAGDTRFLSPRTNSPLFAKTFAQELIDKIQNVQLQQVNAKQTSKTSFVVKAGQLGNLDIDFHKESGKEHVVVFVDNENARHDLLKVVPQIEENLQAKGFTLTGLEVEIRNSDLQQQFGQNQDRSGSDAEHRGTGTDQKGAIEEQNEIENRKYGYNTMEVLA